MIVIDTDVLIEVLRRKVTQGDWGISVITLIEFLRGVSVDKIEKVKEGLEKAFTVVPLTNEVIENCCRLYWYIPIS